MLDSGNRLTRFATVAGLTALAMAACNDSATYPVPAEGTASLTVLLTDAPADYVAEAWVDIGAVTLLPAGQESGAILLAQEGTDGEVDLLTLRNSATALLADAEIDAGEYTEIRLIVESARVVLKEGYTFTNGETEMPLKVPSGAQSGIKLKLGAAEGDEDGSPIFIAPGEMVLVLDFDVNRSFVMQGNAETPAGIKSVLFTPTLRVAVEDVAGSVSGVVTLNDDAGLAALSVEGLVVSAVPLTGDLFDEFQTGTATTNTDGNGAFTFHFMVPGSYEVSVALPDPLPEGTDPDAGVVPAADTVTVEPDQDVTGVDFNIEIILPTSG